MPNIQAASSGKPQSTSGSVPSVRLLTKIEVAGSLSQHNLLIPAPVSDSIASFMKSMEDKFANEYRFEDAFIECQNGLYKVENKYTIGQCFKDFDNVVLKGKMANQEPLVKTVEKQTAKRVQADVTIAEINPKQSISKNQKKRLQKQQEKAGAKVDVETPKKAEVKIQTPQKSEAKQTPKKVADTPKKAEVKVQTPKKAEVKVQTPKKAEAKVQTPKKAEVKVQTPKKAEANIQTPKKAEVKSEVIIDTPKKSSKSEDMTIVSEAKMLGKNAKRKL